VAADDLSSEDLTVDPISSSVHSLFSCRILGLIERLFDPNHSLILATNLMSCLLSYMFYLDYYLSFFRIVYPWVMTYLINNFHYFFSFSLQFKDE